MRAGGGAESLRWCGGCCFCSLALVALVVVVVVVAPALLVAVAVAVAVGGKIPPNSIYHNSRLTASAAVTGNFDITDK